MELETCGGLSVANATEPVLVLGAAGGAGTARSAALLNLCRHHEQRFRCDPIVYRW